MKTSNTDYSDKEQQLIDHFGFWKMASSNYPPSAPKIYEFMALQAFVRDLRGPEVDSLRRCVDALNRGTCCRGTQAWDDLIEFEARDGR